MFARFSWESLWFGINFLISLGYIHPEDSFVPFWLYLASTCLGFLWWFCTHRLFWWRRRHSITCCHVPGSQFVCRFCISFSALNISRRTYVIYLLFNPSVCIAANPATIWVHDPNLKQNCVRRRSDANPWKTRHKACQSSSHDERLYATQSLDVLKHVARARFDSELGCVWMWLSWFLRMILITAQLYSTFTIHSFWHHWLRCWMNSQNSKDALLTLASIHSKNQMCKHGAYLRNSNFIIAPAYQLSCSKYDASKDPIIVKSSTTWSSSWTVFWWCR